MDSIVREKLAALIVGTLAGHKGMTEEEALREANTTLQEENMTQQDEIFEQRDQIEALMLQVEALRNRSSASNWRCC